MKIVEMNEAKGSLSDYARRNRRHAVVVIKRGRPVSALLPIQKGADLERLALSLNAKFQAILDKSRAEVRAGKVVSSEEARRILGLKRAG